ncbi:esterase/lipase family protein [Xanthomonas sp. NCPPB 2632]|uniref:esterase/lipase family protein n=1 Tax=Xanthomonas sp. NCPPB 2632 TaxID=3240912 RepID=UPI003513ED99
MTTLVFVHGWSVTNTSAYGRLPEALATHSAQSGGSLHIVDIRLSEYLTFDDRVTMDDIVRAFDHALRGLQLADGTFDCITHSTGGPVVVAWLNAQRDRPALYAPVRLRHLVMLASAHFGSALAALGKGVVGRLKAWFNGVEPGQRILDWLEHGSPESLAQALNIVHGPDYAARGTFLFDLIGDRPDRKLYDYVNSYTGENGSDGVIRLPAANLNARHVVLTQDRTGGALSMTIAKAPRTAFKLLAGLSHSGGDHGIMAAEPPSPLTVEAIMRCLAVDSPAAYVTLCDAFAAENIQRDRDKVEVETKLLTTRTHIHDPRSLLIFRLLDDRGEPLPQANFLLTAGPTASPNDLPPGFSTDRQANSRSPATVTMFLNHALLTGDGAVVDPRDRRTVLRAAQPSHAPYGVRIVPVDVTGLVRHAIAATANGNDLLDVLGAHETTILDVVLSRHVAEGMFRLTADLKPADFRTPVPGADIP